MKSARFTKRIESFACEHCGAAVEGNGYTNHCPACLWSKHVDINPGDRSSECCGLMSPIGLKKKGKELSIVHRCDLCGLVKPNKVSPKDDIEAVQGLALLIPGWKDKC